MATNTYGGGLGLGPGLHAASGPGLPPSSPLLPSIGLGSLGSIPALGRERSSCSALGLPRKECSYASTTSSKISIAPFPLETLESIMNTFANPWQQSSSQQRGPHPNPTSPPPASRRTTRDTCGSPPGAPGSRLGPRPGSVSFGPPSEAATGSGGRRGRARSPGAGPVRATAQSRPGTDLANGPAPGPQGLGSGVSVSAPGGLPSFSSLQQQQSQAHAQQQGMQQMMLPGGLSTMSLSSRAVAVLQEPESAAHLQRIFPLNAEQLHNHFVIESPNGQPINDLEDACLYDGAASIDGLPPVRQVVVLTTAPDGVPVPHVIPLDQPGPASLRRTGMTATLAAAAAAALHAGGGSGTGTGAGSHLGDSLRTSPRTSGYEGGIVPELALPFSAEPSDADDGNGNDGGWGLPPWSPLRSPAAGRGRSRLSEAGVPPSPISPARCSGATGVSHHATSSYAALPSLTEPGGAPSSSSASNWRRSVAGQAGGGDAPPLPHIGRLSAEHSVQSVPGSQISASSQLHVHGLRAAAGSPQPGTEPGGGGGGGRASRHCSGDGLRHGAYADGCKETSAIVSRLLGRMDSLKEAAAGGAHGGAGSSRGSHGAGGPLERPRGRSAQGRSIPGPLGSLSGQDLVAAAMKQLERTERSMSGSGDQGPASNRPGSRQQAAEAVPESEEQRAAREAASARRAKLARSLTTLLTTGRPATTTGAATHRSHQGGHSTHPGPRRRRRRSTGTSLPGAAAPATAAATSHAVSFAPAATTDAASSASSPCRRPNEPAAAAPAPAAPGADSDDDAASLAVEVEEGGLGPLWDLELAPGELEELVERIDAANEQFKLVEAARERAARMEALGQAPGGEEAARRREGSRPHAVAQVLSSLDAAPDALLSVGLEELLAAVGAALGTVAPAATAATDDGAPSSFPAPAPPPPMSLSLPGMPPPALGCEVLRGRTERYLAALSRANPVAFEEAYAAQAEADYRSSVERAKLRLRQLHGQVAGEPLTSAAKPRNRYDKAVAMLQAHRPFFLPPVVAREAVERAPVNGVTADRPQPPWDVAGSVFRERRRGDARDVFDTEGVLASQFGLDWSRIASKVPFMRMVAREDQGVRGRGGRLALEQELGEIRAELLAMFPLLRSAFVYYSILTPAEVYAGAAEAAAAAAAAAGGDPDAAAAEVAALAAAAAAAPRAGSPARWPSPPPLPGPPAAADADAGAGPAQAAALTPALAAAAREAAAGAADAAAKAVAGAAAAAAAAVAASGGGGFLEIDEQRWLAFCCAAGLAGRAPGCRPSDLRAIFWAVNQEEERNMTLESVENNDNALMRFEFMEALVRAAFGRYITPGVLTDGSDATRRLLRQMRAALPPLAQVEPNAFRRKRLYCAEMEVAVVQHLELLTACFKLYKARDKAKYLGIEHWMSFVESNMLLETHMGVTTRDAKLVFAWSQMVVVDELKLRRKAVSLQLWDFVEAVARLADLVCLPPAEELDLWLLYRLDIGRNTPLPPGHTRMWSYCNALTNGRGGAPIARRPSGRDLLAAPSRPLAAKFQALMEYLAGSLADAWGGVDAHSTAACMMRTAHMLSGGVELA